MRISVNLASQPYEDRSAFLRRWSAIAAVALLVTLALLALAVRQWNGRRQLDRTLASINEQRARVQQERAHTEAVLSQPQNRGTRDRAQFLNSLILRKTFSWTAVFSQLEHTLPPTVKVTAIRPEVDEDNHLNIRLAIESESKAAALEFIRRIEETKQFRDPKLLNEHHGTQQSGAQSSSPNAVTYEIQAEYVPGNQP